jgi:S-adenosylmethionine hydrolase
MSLITLTSDIGHQDYLVSAIKGQLLQIDPSYNIIDVSHGISPFNYPQAAYICRSAFKNFPPHTFHIVMVNLFDKKPERLLLAFHQDQYILCADNGLITMIVEGKPELVIGLPLSSPGPKNTLYCARIMGQAIHRIQNGTRITDIGEPDIEIEVKNPLRPRITENFIEGQIIFIDHFENIIVNITREEFEEKRNGRFFQIIFRHGDKIEKISEYYSNVPEGEKLALFNSAGYLELAINKGNAAGLLGLQGFTEKSQNAQNRLIYQLVKVNFFDEIPEKE